WGLVVRVGFDVRDVRRDGQPEPYRLEQLGNGVRVYIGQSDVLLRPGTYAYRISYVTTGQIGFFATYDELYWNVTGNGWVFPIQRARATVVLPPGAAAFSAVAYTGAQGETGGGADVARRHLGHTIFTTTRPLAPHEGLTVALSWQKGIVAAPTAFERLTALAADNPSMVVAALGLLLVLAYYLAARRRVGRDPEPGTIQPLIHPPEGSPPP